jgi:recombination protein RecR
MKNISSHLDRAIKLLTKLPGIGPKSAARIAFNIFTMKIEDVRELSNAIISLKENIKICSLCGGISDSDICWICVDPSRDARLICAVGDIKDIFAIESTGEFNGVYHVIGGLLSPLDGIGPGELAIKPLLDKCRSGVEEVILALNPTVEGDATSLYLARELSQIGVEVTRIARGIPIGSNLEFADIATIAKSLNGRQKC